MKTLSGNLGRVFHLSSIIVKYFIRPDGEEANTLVCKTSIRGFKSRSGLSSVPQSGINPAQQDKTSMRGCDSRSGLRKSKHLYYPLKHYWGNCKYNISPLPVYSIDFIMFNSYSYFVATEAILANKPICRSCSARFWNTLTGQHECDISHSKKPSLYGHRKTPPKCNGADSLEALNKGYPMHALKLRLRNGHH